ncbi:alpha/beta fold hydrolase [Streptomyces sediminimaris]|uniref:alpha/beta fold hydrolase n=1 Tax=Streptomyces sediminimaris TaxID=3383721 RepID=UPI00399ACFB4
MGDYVALPGVRTWYETDGAEDAEPLLLLHGGMCTNETWGAQRADLAAAYRLFLPERRAHGHTPDVEGPLSYGDMADDTVDFIEAVVETPVHLVGWSDGGIVALLVALVRPDLVRRVVAIGANFRPTPEIAADPAMFEHLTDDGPATAPLRDMYAAASPDGAGHWPVVVRKLADMFAVEPALTTADLSRITAPTLVLAGDDDMMTLEHTIDLYRAIPASQLAIVPGTSHAAPMEKPALVNRLILDFLTKDPVPTMLPVRRAAAHQDT